MTPLQTINSAVVLIGIPAIIAGLLSVGRKFEKIDHLEKSLDRVDKNLWSAISKLTDRVDRLYDLQAGGGTNKRYPVNKK